MRCHVRFSGIPFAPQVAAELGNTGIGNAEAEGELYLNSAFKFDEEDHKALLLEAENVDLVLKGERGDEVRPTIMLDSQSCPSSPIVCAVNRAVCST